MEETKKTSPELYLVYYPDRVLDRGTDVVKDFGPGLAEFVEAMYATMHKHGGIGLAAPQVGYTKAVLVSEVNGVRATLINPMIVESHGKQKSQEGCLSFPGIEVSVERFDKIRVRYQTETGETVYGEWDGLHSVCIQHEMDHLAGVTFLVYLSKLKRDMYKKKVQKNVRKIAVKELTRLWEEEYAKK